MKKIWNYFIEHIIDIVFITLMIFYIISCSIFVYNEPSFKCIGISIGFILIYYLLYKYLTKLQSNNEKLLKIFIVLFSIIIYTIWGYYIKTEPVSDYNVLINGARSVIDGTFTQMSFDKMNYFYWWNFQIGDVMFLAGIMKIFGTGLLSLKVIEILILAFSNLLIYVITCKIFSKKVGLLTTIIYATFTFMIGGSSIINNQHSSFFFALLGIYFLTKNDKISYKLLCGMFFGIAFIIRQSILVMFLSIFAFLIWKLIKNKFKGWKKILISIILIFVPYQIFIKTFDYIMVKTNMVPISSVNSNTPYFKFILGIQWQNMYGEGTVDDLTHFNFDYEKYNIAAKDYVTYNYRNHFGDKVLPFWFEKMERFAGLPDSQIDWAGKKAATSGMGNIFKYYGYAQYILCILMSLCSAIILYKKNTNISFVTNDKFEFINFFKIQFIALFAAYILIEVQSRYRYEQYITLALMATPMLLLIFNYIDKKIIEFKKNKYVIE